MPLIGGPLPSSPLGDSSRSLDQKTGSNKEKKKLNRQRKLRHSTDDELGLNSSSFRDGSLSTPFSGSGSRDHLFSCSGHWSKSVVPQPLPLPQMNFHCLQTSDHPRRSSNVPEKLSDDVLRSLFNLPTTYVRRGFPSGLTIDTSEHNCTLNFASRSAPSSPNLSPQRDSPVFTFNPSQVSSASDGCSAPNITHSSSHPLPLPPALTKPSPIRKSFDMPDNSSIKGQWQKGRLIGHGTYGNVYIATNRATGATCAVKEVEMIQDDPKCVESIKQLEQEMKFLRDLRHPNIVQYYGCETVDDRFCIYLEYVYPGPINKYVRENCGVMTESIVRSFTRHILSGLAYLHSKKTIHRDIKGANLLVNASGVVKLADFGLAKHLAGRFDLSLKGTPHWIAPELLRGDLPKDANPELACGVDIWSLGCTVIEMFTGKPPWSELNEVQAMFNLLSKPPPIPENLSVEGKDFLQRCFQMRPADRPSAVNLLEHPFIRSTHEPCSQDFSGSGRMLNSNETPSESTPSLMQFQSLMKIQQGNFPLLNVETSQHCYFLDSPDAEPSHHQFFHQGDGSHLASPEPRRSFSTSSPSSLLPRVPKNLFRSSGQRKA